MTKQEPMSDLISRQDAINEVEMAFKCVSFDKAERFIVENLNALPSAQPEAKEVQDVKVERDYWKQRAKYAERMEGGNKNDVTGYF